MTRKSFKSVLYSSLCVALLVMPACAKTQEAPQQRAVSQASEFKQEKGMTLQKPFFNVNSFGPKQKPSKPANPNEVAKTAYFKDYKKELVVGKYAPLDKLGYTPSKDMIECATNPTAYYCSDEFTAYLNHSSDRVKVAKDEFVLPINANGKYLDGEYDFRFVIVYVKDGVAYPSKWNIATGSSDPRIETEDLMSVAYGKVGDDVCFYGRTRYNDVESPTYYNCLTVNEKFDPNNKNSEPLVLAKQTYEQLVDADVYNDMISTYESSPSAPNGNLNSFFDAVYEYFPEDNDKYDPNYTEDF